MKTKVFLILIGIIVLNLVLWPKNKGQEYLNEEVVLPTKINITIDGEVIFPGTYSFFKAITLNEVIAYAGGLTSDANILLIDMFELISKSTYITINKKILNDDILELSKVNINTATFKELINVPNITENRAANIILYRKEHGKFLHLEELKNVKYIGNSVFEKIYQYLTV